MRRDPVIAVHGGAGSAPSTAERAAARQAGIDAALAAGLAVLRESGSALDAVCAAVVVLEDDSSFNAGRGAVPTTDGTYELDASVILGDGRRAGAVAAITRAKNPVLAARAVMESTEHVLLAGAGADALDVERPPPGWFDVTSDPGSSGTVGAVALDAHGHLAAATSTGGRRGQLPGRVGDSPIIGAGTWADSSTCAVSGTGAGEAFIRAAFAHAVHSAVAAGRTLDDACAFALEEARRCGGLGGCIAISPAGDVVARHTTEAMAWGAARHG